MELRNKYVIVGIGIFSTILLIGATSVAFGINFTGFFKAFDKTLSPGEHYERNITVRKFYNVSIRFQKETSSSSYLGFTDNESVVVLKDSAGAEILRHTGVNNGRIYLTMTNYELSSVATVSAYNISEYADVIDQPVNDTYTSFSGAKAYITVKVRYASASISGYVIDDLTGDFVSNVTVAAFENDADPATASAIGQDISDTDGRYGMAFDLSSSKALDVYVDGYDVV